MRRFIPIMLSLMLVFSACAEGVIEDMPLIDDETFGSDPVIMTDSDPDGEFPNDWLIEELPDTAPQATTAPGEVPPFAETLVKGTQSAEVKTAQNRLSAMGYLNETPDGTFGTKTQDAVKKFQSNNGLSETGEIDETTWTLLFNGQAAVNRRTLTTSCKGDDVTFVQEQLIRLCFMSGYADGNYGKTTKKAVEDLQTRLIVLDYPDISVTGECDLATQDALSDPSFSGYFVTVKPGDTSSEAKRVEQRLIDLGYMDGQADTEFDDYAVECLRRFQSVCGLTVTGNADSVCMSFLFSVNAPTSDHPLAHDVARGERSKAVMTLQKLLARYGFLSCVPDGAFGEQTSVAIDRLHSYLSGIDSPYAELFADRSFVSTEALDALESTDLHVYAADIDPNSSTDSIRRLQRRLFSLYYMSSYSMDGKFGSGTTNALTKFQETCGLPATGIADEVTQAVLFSDAALENPTEYHLFVSIDEQRVYVYQRNDTGTYDLTQTFICSTGLDDATPTGVFLTTRQLDRWHYFVDYKCWAQYAFQITGAIYFHSVIYSDNTESSLRTSTLYALGRKASHGCIRLKPEDAQFIYENCEARTPVIIY